AFEPEILSCSVPGEQSRGDGGILLFVWAHAKSRGRGGRCGGRWDCRTLRTGLVPELRDRRGPFCCGDGPRRSVAADYGRAMR
ncbi:MAG: hypothetical protein ACK5TX_12945, partial [Planctomyces sp.]